MELGSQIFQAEGLTQASPGQSESASVALGRLFRKRLALKGRNKFKPVVTPALRLIREENVFPGRRSFLALPWAGLSRAFGPHNRHHNY